jgi:hypothetical protein
MSIGPVSGGVSGPRVRAGHARGEPGSDPVDARGEFKHRVRDAPGASMAA